MSKNTIAAVIAATAAGIASADVVTMKFVGTGAGQNVKWKYNGGSEQSTFAGQLRHNITSGTGIGADWVGEHNLYCTDIFQYVATSYKTFDINTPDLAPTSSPMGAARAQALYDVFSAFTDSALVSGIGNEFAAAFQIAVWEIVSDFDGSVGRSSLSVDAGKFKVTKVNGSATRTSSFNNYLNDIFDSIGSSANPNVVALTNGGAQDQLFYIPAPGPIALAGAGMLMLSRRRR